MTEFHIVSFVAIFWKSAHTSTIHTYMWYNDTEGRPVNHERTGAIEESQDSELCYSHIFRQNEISFGIFSSGLVFFFWNGILSVWHKYWKMARIYSVEIHSLQNCSYFNCFFVKIYFTKISNLYDVSPEKIPNNLWNAHKVLCKGSLLSVDSIAIFFAIDFLESNSSFE